MMIEIMFQIQLVFILSHHLADWRTLLIHTSGSLINLTFIPRYIMCSIQTMRELETQSQSAKNKFTIIDILKVQNKEDLKQVN